MQDANSRRLYQRAVEVMPGGVNSPVRAMGSIGRDPIFIDSASGCELVDVDGNRYVDWISSWGPLICGHAHPAVVGALDDAAARGTSYGAATAGEVELAEEVRSRFASVEMLRMVNSGTEATLSAVRLARAATGRERLVKFAGAYHGHVDGLLADAGSGLATHGIPASPGVPEAQAAATTVVPWNDFDAVAAAVEGDAGDPASGPPAAIICEPIPANMGVVPPEPGFIAHLRELADATGALLVADEVISGFRVARGGAQELLGFNADLTIMGKVIGGGLPAAAYGGSAELLERVSPAGDVYQAGTLSGKPPRGRRRARDAAICSTPTLTSVSASSRGASEQGMRDAAAAAGATDRVSVAAVPGLVTLFMAPEPPRSFDDARACDTRAYAALCRELLERGVYPPPSQFEAWFVSLAHDELAIETSCAALAEALAVALG